MPGTAQRPGKRDLFCPMPPPPSSPPTPSFPSFNSRPMGETERAREEGGGVGMTNGLWAASREGRRCQSHESGDARVPPLLLPLRLSPSPPPPPSLRSTIRLSVSISFSARLSDGPVPILPDQQPSLSSSSSLSPGPHNYSLGSVIRVKWSDKSAVWLVYVCEQSLGVVTLTGSQAGFS